MSRGDPVRGRRRRRILPGRSEIATMLPPGHQQIQREELSRLFGQMVGVRLAVVPAILAVGVWVAWNDPVSGRRALLLAAIFAAAGYFVAEWLVFRRRGFTRASVPRNLAVATIIHLVAVTATGGLQSPLVYVAIPLGIAAGVFVRPPWSFAVTAVQVAAVCTLAAGAALRSPFLEVPLLGTEAPTASGAALNALFLSAVLVLGGLAGRALRRTLEATVRRALAAQHESLRAHAERAEELTALSGEIAHELKNPLASVKGLAGLLAQSVPEPKGAERLAVLRREVDRMQSVLDEFLNFSRPLVPLALGHCDVGALCREVAALHEGIARERGVEIVADEAVVPVRCDPRKVKQVLINLVQNALDASPPGAVVELAAADEAGGAAVRVLDRGRGLDAGLGESVFSPGVTTKASGSGLGLTIARSIARQHGGELTLRPRAGGGTEAVLRLPGSPSSAGGGRAA